MWEETWALVSRRVVTPEGMIPAAIIVAEGVIRCITPLGVGSTPAPSIRIVDVGDLAVLPGLVDGHIHINEPGRTEWEGFATATRAAAAGGVTTLVDMPLNSTPVTTTTAALAAKRQAAQGQCMVDVGFHGGLVPGNLADIESLIEAGAFGVSCP
jgi:allantoinase